MAVILPKVDDLKEFMEHLRKQSLNKRQQEIANKVLAQYEELIEFARECTETINYCDDYDNMNFRRVNGYYMGGEG